MRERLTSVEQNDPSKDDHSLRLTRFCDKVSGYDSEPGANFDNG